MDLKLVIELIRSRWLMVTLICLLGGLAGMAISLVSTPRYTATTQLYVTSASGETANAAYQGSLASQQRVQSYIHLVQSRDILNRVLDRVELDMSAGDLRNDVRATSATDTVLLDVSVTSEDPASARDLSNALGDVLTEYVAALETPAGGGEPLAKLTVVGPAETPLVPATPRTGRNVTLGLALGLMFGFGLVMLLHTVDRRVKSKEDVERVVGAPVVGDLPHNPDRATEHAVSFRHGFSPDAESYRNLRTNLQFMNVDQPPRKLLVTSTQAGEGKSTTTLNLALVLAEAGFSVAIVEGDLRRPRIANYMGLRDKVGLTNVLSGQADILDVTQHTQWEGVDLLACGPVPPNPSELLGSNSAELAVERIASLYDYVLIDSPPVLPVSDAQILSRLVDGILIVVRIESTKEDDLARAVDLLRRTPSRILGVVFSMSKRGAEKKSYYYYDSDQQDGRIPS